MTLSIVHQDPHIIVCEKPAGVLSEGEGDRALPTLLAELLRAKGEREEIFPVHRLDRETTGLMVYARTREAAASLSRAITESRFQKEYLTLVCGTPEKDQDTLRDLLFFDRARGKTFVVDRVRKGVKDASLDYTVIERREKHTLLRVRLHTGRTHQIRAQFASRGMPVRGDRRYGAPAEGFPLSLHSCYLSFPHPKTGEILEFVRDAHTFFEKKVGKETFN